MTSSRSALLVVIALLAAATVYEALVALGSIDLGSQPGEGPSGERLVLTVAVAAILAGAALALAGSRVFPIELLGPGAAGFLVARFYSFDPYHLPTLRRMSDGGLVSPALVYLVIVAAVLAGALIRVRPWIGHPLTAAVLLGSALLALLAAGGH